MTPAGGARQGAGRKPGSPNHIAGPGRMPRSWRLKEGDVFVTYETSGDSASLMLEARVKQVTRTKLILTWGGFDLVLIR